MADFQTCPRCRAVYIGAHCPTCQKAATEESRKTPSPSQLQPGELFHGLEIQEVLGRGGMGVVYKARQPSLNRSLAVKLLPSDARPDFADRFEREARTLAALSHPSIVGIHDFGHDERGYFFSMELVDGVSLRDHLKARKVDVSEALRITLQICEALEYAHGEGVIHRDIKPENILIDRKGHVKVADFGLAKFQGPSEGTLLVTATGVTIGTLAYMSPEQMENSRNVDARSDLYSLGVVLYEMLTGERPAGRFDPPSKKAAVPVALDAVVMKVLAKNPAERLSSVTEFKNALTQSTSSASAPSAPRKTLRLLWMVVPAAAILLGVALFLVPRWLRRAPVSTPVAATTIPSPAGSGAGKETEQPKDKPGETAKFTEIPKEVGKSPTGDSVSAKPAEKPKETEKPLITFEDPRSLSAQVESVQAVAFSPDGRILASAGVGNVLILWEVSSGKRIATVNVNGIATSALSFSPDGEFLAALVSNVNSVTLQRWDVRTPKQPQPQSPISAAGTCLAVSLDGQAYAWCTETAIQVWDASTSKTIASLSCRDAILSLTFHPGGLGLASGGEDGTVRLWDLTAKKEWSRWKAHRSEVNAVAFSPDGQTLASGGADRCVRLWKSFSDTELWKVELHSVTALAFHPDGAVLAASGEDGQIRILDVKESAELTALAGPSQEAYSVAFSPNGKWLASGGEGRSLRLWTVRRP